MASYLDIVSATSSRSESSSSSSTEVEVVDDRPFLIVASSKEVDYHRGKNAGACSNEEDEEKSRVIIDVVSHDRARGFQFHQRATWYDERMKRDLRPKNYRRPGSCKVTRREFGNRSAKTLRWFYGCGCRARMWNSLSRRDEAREELLKARAALLSK